MEGHWYGCITIKKWPPLKNEAKASRHLVSKDQINPPMTIAVFQCSLTNAGINEHTSTVQRNQNNVDLHGRMPRQKPQFTKYNKQLNYAKARSILGESFMVVLNKNRDLGKWLTGEH